MGQQTVDASSINAFKAKLTRVSDNRMGFFMKKSVKPQASLMEK